MDYCKEVSGVMETMINYGNAYYSFKEQPLLVNVQLLQVL